MSVQLPELHGCLGQGHLVLFSSLLSGYMQHSDMLCHEHPLERCQLRRTSSARLHLH